jgi:hypothetical protein
MPREPREVWEKRIERWKDCGLTAKEFAAEVGVNVHTLQGWKWRLQSKRHQGAQGGGRSTSPSFVEVVAPIAVGCGPSRAECQAAAEPIEVVLSSGIRVRVPVAFDAGALRRVVDALEAR